VGLVEEQPEDTADAATNNSGALLAHASGYS